MTYTNDWQERQPDRHWRRVDESRRLTLDVMMIGDAWEYVVRRADGIVVAHRTGFPSPEDAREAAGREGLAS